MATADRRNFLDRPAAYVRNTSGTLAVQSRSWSVRKGDCAVVCSIEWAVPLCHLEPQRAGYSRGALGTATDNRWQLHKGTSLGPDGLRHGTVAYMPRTPNVDVMFRFDLEVNHRTVTESLRVVIPPHPELIQSGQESYPAGPATASTSEQIRADTAAASPVKAPAKRGSKRRRRLH